MDVISSVYTFLASFFAALAAVLAVVLGYAYIQANSRTAAHTHTDARAADAPTHSSQNATTTGEPPSAAASTSAPSSTEPSDTPTPASAASASLIVPPCLEVKAIFASTTGTCERYAHILEREAFAMHVSGWHIRVTPVNAAGYDIDSIEKETCVLFLMPTWTGGVPPETGRILCAHVRDIATDFRVPKDALANLRYAVFALGNSEYDANWGRVGVELDADLRNRCAQPLLPVERGDDSKDMDACFEAWRARLWPILCEMYAEQYGAPPDEDAADAADMGCSTCSSAVPSTRVYNSARGAAAAEHMEDMATDMANEDGCGDACACKSGSAGESGPGCCADSVAESVATRDTRATQGASGTGAWLTQKEYRRQKRRAAEEAERTARLAARLAERQAAEAAEAAAAAEAAIRAADPDVILTDEDRLNNRLLAEADGIADYVDSDEEGAGAAAQAAAPPASGEGLTDLEDLGAAMSSMLAGKKAAANPAKPPQEMVTAAQRKALTKEGYRIIGTHSAVKLCRWTKAQLRGRGGCYKHTFYGITSYQCMEATPSLACANKCVFCWRHHKNPVGREWRWQVDEPDMIVDEAVSRHQAMINELKGMPGLKPDRWAEAMTVRHCALSLVGEPIMYPHINDLVRLLHARRISTFMVTNAQFPECISRLSPVTQLYVSIDAATKETLKAIDRPLFADFWERFLTSLDALREKKQRTVYRLTLVKGQNMSELENYAELVARGRPDLIEIKGVTYCGTSPGSDLTMKNVPWHHEVKEFCELLCARLGGDYDLAAEHAHSCCVLLAKTCFRIEGEWYTHIDYDRFHELVQRYYESEGTAKFTTMDYLAKTPSWAVYNAPEGGFDPVEMRWRRNKDGTVAEIEYKTSESGCG